MGDYFNYYDEDLLPRDLDTGGYMLIRDRVHTELYMFPDAVGGSSFFMPALVPLEVSLVCSSEHLASPCSKNGKFLLVIREKTSTIEQLQTSEQSAPR